MMSRIFWIAVAVDVVAGLYLLKTLNHGYLVLLYMIFVAVMAVAAAAFLLFRGEGMRIASFALFLLPSIPWIFFAAASAFKNVSDERQAEGEAYFSGRALHLARALHDNDLVSVQERIPAAGDLNQPHGGGMTLLLFGVLRARGDGQPSREIVRALLAAGGDPRREKNAAMLQHAIWAGPNLTKMLLDAGADPNLISDRKRPAWWDAIDTPADDKGELLRVMLDHGVDLKLRDSAGRGPFALAAERGNWSAAYRMTQLGADWKNERVGGRPVLEALAQSIRDRDENGIAVPDEARKMLAELAKENPSFVMAPAVMTKLGFERTIGDADIDDPEKNERVLARLEQQPEWVRQVSEFLNPAKPYFVRSKAAYLLTLRPAVMNAELRDKCWTVIHQELAGMEPLGPEPDKSAFHADIGPLRMLSAIARGLVRLPGPISEGHRADLAALRDRVTARRKSSDPQAARLPDLKNADWIAGR